MYDVLPTVSMLEIWIVWLFITIVVLFYKRELYEMSQQST